MKKSLILFFTLILYIVLPLAASAETKDVIDIKRQNVFHDYDEAHLIALAAATCAGTYVPDGIASEYSYLGEYGFVIQPYTVDDGVREANFMFAYNKTITQGKKLFVLAFRGSATLKDWKVNLATSKVVYGGTNPEEFVEIAKEAKDSSIPAVHRGFNEYVNAAFSLKPEIMGEGKDIYAILKDDQDAVLLLTGHSLGGAAATLFAERLVSMGIPKEKVPVITFGAPAIGNAAFVEAYGDKIDLLRIKTSHDPIPGGLQTFIGGFKQFGREKVFNLSSRFADYQHPVSYYFDLAVKNYYEDYDEAIEAGILKARPTKKITNNAPLVAIVVGAPRNIQSRPFTPDIKRFILDEYRAVLPSYIVLENNADLYDFTKYDLGQMAEEARTAGADYILVLEIDSKRLAQEDKWYISMSQAMFNVDGSLVSLSSYGRRLTYDQGVMQCTISNLEQCRNELKEKFSWIRTRIE
ncbi:MAG: lipase family protein [Acidaminococcaceae bacterium]